jgi:hypothetical protein
MQQVSTQGWHTAEWGVWGWAETIVKLVGIGAGMLAFIQSDSSRAFVVGGNPHLAAVILLALLVLLTVGALAIRFGQREVISMIFAVLNFLGHVGLLIALLRVPDQRTLPIVFGVAFVLGELVKQRFLAVTGYTESGRSSSAMMNFSRGLAVVYALFTVLVLL